MMNKTQALPWQSSELNHVILPLPDGIAVIMVRMWRMLESVSQSVTISPLSNIFDIYIGNYTLQYGGLVSLPNSLRMSPAAFSYFQLIVLVYTFHSPSVYFHQTALTNPTYITEGCCTSSDISKLPVQDKMAGRQNQQVPGEVSGACNRLRAPYFPQELDWTSAEREDCIRKAHAALFMCRM